MRYKWQPDKEFFVFQDNRTLCNSGRVGQYPCVWILSITIVPRIVPIPHSSFSSFCLSDGLMTSYHQRQPHVCLMTSYHQRQPHVFSPNSFNNPFSGLKDRPQGATFSWPVNVRLTEAVSAGRMGDCRPDCHANIIQTTSSNCLLEK